MVEEESIVEQRLQEIDIHVSCEYFCLQQERDGQDDAMYEGGEENLDRF